MKGNESPGGWERDKKAGQSASCVGKKTASEGISLYELDDFCINKPLRKSWLHLSVEGEHRLQPLYYMLPRWLRLYAEQQSTAWPRIDSPAARNGSSWEWENQRRSSEMDFAKQCPPWMPAGAGIFASSRCALAQAGAPCAAPYPHDAQSL